MFLWKKHSVWDQVRRHRIIDEGKRGQSFEIENGREFCFRCKNREKEKKNQIKTAREKIDQSFALFFHLKILHCMIR